MSKSNTKEKVQERLQEYVGKKMTKEEVYRKEIKDLSDEELNDELLRPTGVWKEDVLRESIRRILLK